MTRSSPGPTNIDNISKKIPSGIGALNRVRPFIKTHGATKIHQALTLNDKRKSKSSKNGREIHTCTYSCCFVYKTYYFFCICFFFGCFCFCVVVFCCCYCFFTFLLLSSLWIPQRIRKRREKIEFTFFQSLSRRLLYQK